MTAHRITRQYAKWIRISDAQMEALNLHPDPDRPRWTYEIRPHATDRCAPSTAAAAGEPKGIPAEPVSPPDDQRTCARLPTTV